MAASFSVSLNADIERTLQDLAKEIAAIPQELFYKIAARTPVSKGHLLSNWNASVGSPNYSLSNQFGTKANLLPAAKSHIHSVVTSSLFYKKDNTVYYSNGTRYAWRAEWGGWARTQPYAMIGLSVIEIVTKFK